MCTLILWQSQQIKDWTDNFVGRDAVTVELLALEVLTHG
jgi:hypothetical protein